MVRHPSAVHAAARPSRGTPNPVRRRLCGPVIGAAAVAAGIILVACACAGRSPTPARPRIPLPAAAVTPAPAFAADIQNGARIFRAYCERCHGPQGAGDGPLAPGLSPPPPDWTRPGALRDRAPGQLFTSIRRGVLGSSMKRFDTVLDEPSTWDVVFYLFTRPADVRSRAAAGEAYRRSCAGCHGANGGGLVPGAPRLARPDWVVLSRDALAERVAGAHPSAASYASGGEARLSAERIWDWLIAPPLAAPAGGTPEPAGPSSDASPSPVP